MSKFNKSWRKKDKKKEREIFYFRQHHHRNSFCPYLLPEWVLEVWVRARKTKCGNGITKKDNVYISEFIWVFWLNIVKFEINLCYRYCSNLFRNLRKESEFRQYHCRNLTKVRERKRKSGREKFLIFGNTITEIPSAHTCCPSECSKCECAQEKPNVAMALPK